MNNDLNQKIQVLTQKAKENGGKDGGMKAKENNVIPNSLADHIKTKEQAKSFFTLLRAL